LSTKKEFGGELYVSYQEEGVSHDFPLTDSIWIKAGDYLTTGIRAEIRTPQSKTVSMNIDLNGGGFLTEANTVLRLNPVSIYHRASNYLPLINSLPFVFLSGKLTMN
jgi:hypothetical protein